MAEDTATPTGTPQEEPMLEISSEDLAAEAPPPVPELQLPPAPPEPHHDDREVIIVQEPPAPAGPLVPETPVMPEPVPAVAAAPPPVAYEPPPAPVVPPPLVATPAQPAVVQPAPTPIMATDQWYTTSGGQVYGPYSAADLRAWLQSGQVSWDTQASRGEGDAWRPLSQIAEFNPAPTYGAPVGAVAIPGKKDKTIAGILGIVLGWAGGHHWYLGNYAYAGIYLGISVISVFTLSWIPGIAGLIEGIIYLAATDEKFQSNYKKWFLAGP